MRIYNKLNVSTVFKARSQFGLDILEYTFNPFRQIKYIINPENLLNTKLSYTEFINQKHYIIIKSKIFCIDNLCAYYQIDKIKLYWYNQPWHELLLCLFLKETGELVCETIDRSSSRNLGPNPLSLQPLRVGHNKLMFPSAKFCFLLPSESYLFLI